MRQSSLFGHAIEVFSEFRENPAIPADAVIRRFFLARKYLGAKDRRTIADVYFGTIRNWRRLDALIADAFEDHVVTSARMIAAFAVVYLAQAPEEVHATFDEIPHKESIALESLNAIADPQREVARLADHSLQDRLGIRYSYPSWFVARLLEEYGETETPFLLESLNREAPTSIRANTLLTDREALASELAAEGCETTFSRLAEDGLLLAKRTNIFGSPAFQRGAFEVQDEASQLVVPLAGIRKTSIKVLDACAGAGGKTLHLSAQLNNRGEVFASDAEDWKLDELKIRSRRSGAQNIRIVKSADRERFLGPDKAGTFDLVVLDVPCTGSGTVRRNPGIKWILTPKLLSDLLAKQRMILEANVGFVKQGGTLLYATCSILHEEGEEQIENFVRDNPEFTVEESLRTRPDRDGCDGFFAVRIRKVSASGRV